jgi:hypothetical protein
MAIFGCNTGEARRSGGDLGRGGDGGVLRAGTLGGEKNRRSYFWVARLGPIGIGRERWDLGSQQIWEVK